MNERAIESMAFFESCCQTPRAKAILEMAKERQIQDRKVCAVNCAEYPITEYAMQLYCYASQIGCFQESDNESYVVVALLLAMEISKDDYWSYGSKLMTDVINKKITVSRKEWEAVMAQYGTNQTNPDKEYLLEHNMMAAAFHCADLLTRILSLPGKSALPGDQVNSELHKKLESCWGNNAVDTVMRLAEVFIPASLGTECFTQIVRPMIAGMTKSGVLGFPARLNEDRSMKISIAEHICSVVWYYAEIVKPRTEAEIGMLFLAALCQDLRKTCDYRMSYGTRKKFCENGRYSEPDGRKFNWEQYVQYEKDHQIRLAHNKSLFMATRYLQEHLPESVASAIDSSSYNIDMNAYVEYAMMEEPLGLYLHVADVISAAYLATAQQPETQKV